MRFAAELRHLPDFVKISHSVFALPFALASLILASDGWPGGRPLLLVIAAVVTARLAAMTFNRIADRKWDALNPRTQERHLPTGKISLPTAWLVLLWTTAAFIFIAGLINHLAFILSPVALAFVLGYSFTKRFTSFSHFVLGAALGIAPLGAWVAARGELASTTPWLLALSVLCWVAGFDIIYALQDEGFDRTQQLHSMVVRLGPAAALRLVRLLHLIMWFLLFAIRWVTPTTWAYDAGCGLIAGFLLWEHWLMCRSNPDGLQKAFFHANALVSFAYLVTVVLNAFFRVE